MLEILQYYFDNNIILCWIFFYILHKLQSCDVLVFSSLKIVYCEQVKRLERGYVGIIGKEYFIYLYSSIRIKAFTSRNIRARQFKADLYPFNPDKVLSNMPKSLRELIDIELNITKALSCTHDEVLMTSITLILAEAVTSFLNVIKQVFNNKANRYYKGKL